MDSFKKLCYHHLSMPEIANILTLLIEERNRLNRAIEALQGPIKRRGRPAKSAGAVPTSRKRPARTAAQRKAQSERMKKSWAARKKQEKGAAKQ